VRIPLDEKKLIEDLKHSDRSAINTLFLQYHAPLCKISLRIVRNTDDAKDVVQDVFIKLWRNRKALNITYSLEAYLKRAVINASLNCIESKKKFTTTDLHDPVFNKSTEGNPEEINELQLHIDNAIGALPHRTKAVFTLIRFDAMSYNEVSETLHISVKAVEKEMMKALKLLRTALKDYLPSLILFALF
jgi:RNA polymerase sigma-70 factor (ECF subfamily)